jgi:hypothetical protein
LQKKRHPPKRVPVVVVPSLNWDLGLSQDHELSRRGSAGSVKQT